MAVRHHQRGRRGGIHNQVKRQQMLRFRDIKAGSLNITHREKEGTPPAHHAAFTYMFRDTFRPRRQATSRQRAKTPRRRRPSPRGHQTTTSPSHLLRGPLPSRPRPSPRRRPSAACRCPCRTLPVRRLARLSLPDNTAAGRAHTCIYMKIIIDRKEEVGYGPREKGRGATPSENPPGENYPFFLPFFFFFEACRFSPLGGAVFALVCLQGSGAVGCFGSKKGTARRTLKLNKLATINQRRNGFADFVPLL